MELENLVKLINAVSDSELTGFRYEENGVKLHLTKKGEKVQATQVVMGTPVAAEVPKAEIPEKEEKTAGGKVVESPLVGTFYAANAPDQPPLVSVGDTVTRGQTLCIIEAMKTMNSIESPCDGKISRILVQDGELVEFHQPLIVIE